MQPFRLADEGGLLLRRKMQFEHSECLAECRRSGGDKAVQPELVGSLPDPLAPRVLTNWAPQILGRETYCGAIVLNAKVQNGRERDLNRQKATRTHHVASHAFHIVDEMPIRLDDHRVGGTSKVQDGIGAGSTPTPARGATCKRSHGRRDMALKDPADLDRPTAGNCDGEIPIHLHGPCAQTVDCVKNRLKVTCNEQVDRTLAA